MLVRMFHGCVVPGMEDRYSSYLHDTAAPKILANPGARKVEIFEPMIEGDAFVVESVWDDTDALISFAGPSWDQPHVLPSEVEMLASASVSHYRSGSTYRGSIVTSPSGRVSIDISAGVVVISGDVYQLPPLEGSLLTELVQREGHFMGSAELARIVWRDSAAVRPNDVRRCVYRLRKLTNDHHRTDPLVHSRRGYGYMFRE
ncbi:MAG: winged helix-turn-helix domain-containing protein [Actinomycetota bacterium]